MRLPALQAMDIDPAGERRAYFRRFALIGRKVLRGHEMELVSGSLFSRSALVKGRVFRALEILLETNELDSLTIRQICEQAKIGKTTYYTYFHDKYDIVQWYTDLGYEMGVARIGRDLDWHSGHVVSTTFYFMHLDMLRAAFRSHDYNGISQYSLRRREANMTSTLESFKRVDVTQHVRLIIAGLAAGELAVFLRAMKAEVVPNVEEVVDAMLCITPLQLYELLEIPPIPPSVLEREVACLHLIDRILTH